MSDRHDKTAAWGQHIWNTCYRGQTLASQDCDVCGVTPYEWLRTAVITVHVTEQDIEQAEVSTTDERVVDPVELALAREAGLDDPIIGPFPCSRVVGSDYNYELPEKAAALVRRYLKGKPVAPIAFKWWPGRGYVRGAVRLIPRSQP